MTLPTSVSSEAVWPAPVRLSLHLAPAVNGLRTGKIAGEQGGGIPSYRKDGVQSGPKVKNQSGT